MWPGVSATNPIAMLSIRVPNEQNRYKGNNYGGYVNPAYDALYEQFVATLDRDAQFSVLADMMAILADEIPVMPVFYYGIGASSAPVSATMTGTITKSVPMILLRRVGVSAPVSATMTGTITKSVPMTLLRRVGVSAMNAGNLRCRRR